jgi:hypothetical protein
MHSTCNWSAQHVAAYDNLVNREVSNFFHTASSAGSIAVNVVKDSYSHNPSSIALGSSDTPRQQILVAAIVAVAHIGQ